MATLYVTEFQFQHVDQGRPVPCAFGAPITNNNIAITGGSLQSNPFSANTFLIRVHSDAICSILVGTNPTVSTSDARMAANQTEYFGVQPGQIIAVISNV